jgi:hypothetical protein
MLIAPCALTTAGAAIVATPATAAPPRNLRRVADVVCLLLAIRFPSLGCQAFPRSAFLVFLQSINTEALSLSLYLFLSVDKPKTTALRVSPTQKGGATPTALRQGAQMRLSAAPFGYGALRKQIL